jgi:HemN C-terminal domain
VDRAAFAARFGKPVEVALPALAEAVDLGLVEAAPEAFRLTERGIEHADVLGDWLQSDAVRTARSAWAPQ